MAYPGSLLGPSPSHRVKVDESCSAWWKAKPCAAATATNLLWRMGTRSQTATRPSSRHRATTSARESEVGRVRDAAHARTPPALPPSGFKPCRALQVGLMHGSLGFYLVYHRVKRPLMRSNRRGDAASSAFYVVRFGVFTKH